MWALNLLSKVFVFLNIGFQDIKKTKQNIKQIAKTSISVYCCSWWSVLSKYGIVDY